MDLKAGMKVRILDENAKGEIIEILENSRVSVRVDGFDYIYSSSDLIIEKQVDYASNNHAFNIQEPTSKPGGGTASDYNKKIKGLEKTIDLHYEELHPAKKHYNAYEKLNYQLSVFAKCFEECQEKKYKKLTVIHGKGKGQLKQEIYRFLSQKNVRFHHAPFSEGGATEVLF